MGHSDLVTCYNCGRTRDKHDADSPPTDPGEDRHDWSTTSELDNARALIEGRVTGAHHGESRKGGGWAWLDVRIDPEEDVEASEAAAQLLKSRGFAFVALKTGDVPTLRFSKEL
jgi:hypothetical protein